MAVEIRWGDSGELTSQLIANTGEPADILITDNVADIWRAADRGALRPLLSDAVAAHADFLKDPDGFWAAVDVSFHAIYHASGARPRTVRLDDLATPGFTGRICLSTARIGSNRSLISFLIQERGVKDAERLFRLLVRNLARPPFASHAAMLEAVREGECDYAIGIWRRTPEGVTPLSLAPPTVDIDAIGVGRHARNADAAQAVVDWLLENRFVGIRRKIERYPPAVYTAGYHDEEARLLAERAGYR